MPKTIENNGFEAKDQLKQQVDLNKNQQVEFDEIQKFLGVEKFDASNAQEIRDAIDSKLDDKEDKIAFNELLDELVGLDDQKSFEVATLKNEIAKELKQTGQDVITAYGEVSYLDNSSEYSSKRLNDESDSIGSYIENSIGLVNNEVFGEKIDFAELNDELNWGSAIDAIVKAKNEGILSKLIEQEKEGSRADRHETFSKKLGYNYAGLIFNGDEADCLFFLAKEYEANQSLKMQFNKISQLKNNGIRVADIENTRMLINSVSENEVLAVLADYDNDGIVDNSTDGEMFGERKDKGVIFGSQMYDLLTDLDKRIGDQLYKNIGDLMGKNISNKADLYNTIKENPEFKYELLNKLFLLGGTIDLEAILRDGKPGAVAYMGAITEITEKVKNDETLSYIKMRLETQFNEQMAPQIEKLKAIGSEDPVVLSAIERYESKEMTKSILDWFELRGVNFIVNLKSIMLNVGSDDLDTVYDNSVSSVQFQLGLVNGVPGIGVSYNSESTYGEYNENSETESIGLFGLIPYLVFGEKELKNKDEIKKAGFVDFKTEGKYDSYNLNLGVINGFTYKSERSIEKGIKLKAEMLREDLDNYFDFEQSDLDSLDKVQGKLFDNLTTYSDQDSQQYVKAAVNNTIVSLENIGFNDFSLDAKKLLIERTKTFYVNRFIESAGQENEGVHFGGAFVSLQFIGSWVPVLFFGVELEHMRLKYVRNEMKAFQDDAVLVTGTGSKDQKSDSVEGLASELDLLLEDAGIEVSIVDGKVALKSVDGKSVFYRLNTYVDINSISYKQMTLKDGMLLLGNVGEIHYHSKRTARGEEHFLVIGQKGVGPNTLRLDDTFNDSLSANEISTPVLAGTTKGQQLKNKTPETRIDSKAKVTSELETFKNPEFEKFVNDNLFKFAELPRLRADDFRDFKRQLSAQEYSKAFITFRRMTIENPDHSKNPQPYDWLRNTKFMEDFFKVYKDNSTFFQENRLKDNPILESKVAYMVSQVNDAMMVDMMTADKLTFKESEKKSKALEYVDQIFAEGKTYTDGKGRVRISTKPHKDNWNTGGISKKGVTDMIEAFFNPEFRKEYTGEDLTYKQLWDRPIPGLNQTYGHVFSRLMSYNKHKFENPNDSQYIGVNKAKRLYSLLQPNIDMMDKSYLNESSNSSRIGGFKKLLKQENLNEDSVLSYRSKIQDKLGFDNAGSWEPVSHPNMIAFTASYKIDGNKESMGRQFDAMPSGVTTIVDGKTVKIDESDTNTIDYIKSRIEKLPYLPVMAKSMSMSEQEVSTLLQEGSVIVNRNGKNHTISIQRDFHFFLYGRCANESLGIGFDTITVNGEQLPIELSANGTVSAYIPTLDGKRIPLGLYFGRLWDRDGGGSLDDLDPNTNPNSETGLVNTGGKGTGGGGNTNTSGGTGRI